MNRWTRLLRSLGRWPCAAMTAAACLAQVTAASALGAPASECAPSVARWQRTSGVFTESTAHVGHTVAFAPPREARRGAIGSLAGVYAARQGSGAGSGAGSSVREPAASRILPQQHALEEPMPQRPPGLAFLFSAILPGAGQLYNGNRRGYAFLGIEAVAWFTRLHYSNAGDTRRDDYRRFADRHWDLQRYRDSQNLDGCVWSEGADSTIATLYESGGGRYYEEIGRDDYRCGWDDYDEGLATDPAARSPHRREYLDFRATENSLRDKASLALGILVLNRVVSAVDAFRTAKSRESGSSPSLRLESAVEGGWTTPRAVFRLVKEFP